jgi:regulator of sigma E protease
MSGVVQTVLLFVLPYLCMLTVVVTIHEFGHFLTARAFGVAIDRFSLGFGPALFSWRDKIGTEWRLSAIPLGGYVRFAGDENAASVPDSEDLAEMRKRIAMSEGVGAVKRYFHFKPLWQRALVVAAGPFANFVLAIAIFAVLFGVFGKPVTPAVIGKMETGGAAEQAGFLAGDRILKADGHTIGGFEDLKFYVILRVDTPIDFTIQRGGAQQVVTATPKRGLLPGPLIGRPTGGQLGIYNDPHWPTTIQRFGPVAAVGEGAVETWRRIDLTMFYISRIFTGHESGDQLSGPIGTLALTGAAAKQGADAATRAHAPALWGVLLTSAELAASISIAVGFLNLLPIPMLDGGHLLFYAYEGAARRPVGARAQAAGYRVGLVLILGLVLFATWNDIQNLRVFQFIGGLFS